MARAKRAGTVKRVTEEFIEPEEQSFPEDLLDDAAEALQAVHEKFGTAGLTYKVYKRTQGGDSYCFENDDFNEGFCQEAYGGGRYLVKIIVNGKFKEAHEVLIAERVRKPGETAAVEQQNPVVQALREQLAFVQNLALHRPEPVAAPTMKEIVEAIVAMQALSKPADSGDFEKFRTMLEIAKDMAGGGSGGDWKTELLKTAREVGAPMLAHYANGQQQPAVNVPARQVAAATEVEPVIPMDLALKQGIDTLKSKVMAGLPFELVVDWVVFNRTDPLYQPFIQAILTQDFDSFAKLDPEISKPPYETWFKNLHEGVKAAFNDESVELEDDTVRAAGDGGHVADNGGAGKNGKRKSVV